MSVSDSVIQSLKQHIETQKLKHEDRILEEETFKNAHIQCILNSLSAQQQGPLLERFCIQKQNFTKNNSSDCIGDCSKDGNHYEIKCSLGGRLHNRFNFVQIRPFQKVSHQILTAYHLTEFNVHEAGELYVFDIPKEAMQSLIVRQGSYAHGTKKKNGEITIDDLLLETNQKEQAIRTTIGDSCWEALQEFRELTYN